MCSGEKSVNFFQKCSFFIFSLPVKNSLNQPKTLVKTGGCWCGHFWMLIDMDGVTVCTVAGGAVFCGKVFSLVLRPLADTYKHLELSVHVPVAKPKTQAAHRPVCHNVRESR